MAARFANNLQSTIILQVMVSESGHKQTDRQTGYGVVTEEEFEDGWRDRHCEEFEGLRTSLLALRIL
jgi:hypothetical protein